MPTSHYIQLIIALSLAIVIFVCAYSLKERLIISILVALIPFQLITSRFGTSNMVFTYIIGAAFLLNGRLKQFPMLGAILFVVFSYLLSLSQVHRSTYFDHIIYLVIMGSNVVIFYLIYNFVLNDANPKAFFTLLIVMNIIVIVYCLIKLLPGIEHFSFFGIDELSLTASKEAQRRLVGPFNAVGLNAEYHVIQMFILGYLLLSKNVKWKQRGILALISANFAFLVASGNRGGVFTLVIGGVLFFWLYRKELGLLRMLKTNVAMIAIFVLVSLLIINFTRYNVLYERIADTEFRDGIPDTRASVWPIAWSEIKRKPIVGHGPRFWLFNHWDRQFPDHTPMSYPHNLYLFILYTVGILGLLAYLIFVYSMFQKFRKARRAKTYHVFIGGLPNLAMVLLFAFLIDQIKVEFLRISTTDYQHYIFALFGAFTGYSQLLLKKDLSK